MALQANCRLGNREQFAVRRAMGRMAGHAVFHHRGMLERHRAAHRLVAAQTLFALALKHGFVAVMRIVTADAGQGAFLHRMMGAHVEAGGHVLMALDAGDRIFLDFLRTRKGFLDERRSVHFVAIDALSARFAVLGEAPVDQLLVFFVTGQALLLLGKRDRPFGAEPPPARFHGVTRQTFDIEVTGFDFPGLDGFVTFQAGGCSQWLARLQSHGARRRYFGGLDLIDIEGFCRILLGDFHRTRRYISHHRKDGQAR